MSHHYATPGVYIEEVTGPGVIAGVGTSTAAFIGPALRGPLGTPQRISSFDEFIETYGGTRGNRPWPYLFVEDRPYSMAFAVEGFFTNGGEQAYIVRVGTAAQSSLAIENRDTPAQGVFVVRAKQDGAAGDQITVETQLYCTQHVATGQTTISVHVTGQVGGQSVSMITVADASDFQVGDVVVDDTAPANPPARITRIANTILTLDQEWNNVNVGDQLSIADIDNARNTFRLESSAGFYAGGVAILHGGAVQERVTIASVSTQTNFVTLTAAPQNTYGLTTAAPTLTAIRVVALGQAVRNPAVQPAQVTVAGQPVTTITVNDASELRPGDLIVDEHANQARIQRIASNVLTLDRVWNNVGQQIRIADIIPAQMTFRLSDTTGLYPGTVALLRGDNQASPGTEVEEYVVIQSVDGAGFVTLESTPARVSAYNMGVAAGAEPSLIPQEFRLIVSPPPDDAGTRPSAERFENLSLNPHHPRYIFNPDLITSSWVTVEQPDTPPTTSGYPAQLVAITAATSLENGADDDPLLLTSTEYQDGLEALRDVDNVNIVCIPDAAAHNEWETIQNAMISHCLNLADRVAVLDSRYGMAPSGSNSIEDQRSRVTAARGFAALYYPWLTVRDPRSSSAQTRKLDVPPSGHIAGVYARTDAERGVHKAPANTDVRGVLGLERILSDRQQGPLNLLGINLLRIFPGNRQVIVWGARTTVDPTITDWVYVPIRRLLLYIEESIQEGIRWAVFEPNNLALWKKLKRTISDFLTRVWRDGALFGATAEEAFYVRIDEALNPDSVRKLGRLYIEIGVRPSYPAEFIIVRIGLWDGGAEISES